jgi:hypothetical protein
MNQKCEKVLFRRFLSFIVPEMGIFHIFFARAFARAEVPKALRSKRVQPYVVALAVDSPRLVSGHRFGRGSLGALQEIAGQSI